jgi:hypothetical protein
MWTPSSVIQDLWQPDTPYGTDSKKDVKGEGETKVKAKKAKKPAAEEAK